MGPVQILVVGFDAPNFQGEVLDEFRRLREEDIVRLVDLLVVQKDANGDLVSVEIGGEPGQTGAITRALIGADDARMPVGPLPEGVGQADTWDVADAIAPGTTAAVVLLEHRWAIPLQEAMARAGATAFADAWLHVEDLKRAGLDVAQPAPVGG